MIGILFTCAQVVVRSLLAAEPLVGPRMEHAERPTLSTAQTPIGPPDEPPH